MAGGGGAAKPAAVRASCASGRRALVYQSDRHYRYSMREGAMPDADLSRQIDRALEGIRFGSVAIVVHDGRMVQIERREKVWLAADSCPPWS